MNTADTRRTDCSIGESQCAGARPTGTARHYAHAAHGFHFVDDRLHLVRIDVFTAGFDEFFLRLATGVEQVAVFIEPA